ncbi:MAG TPA: flagellar biosynthetic protein FliO [Candidatus Acidoferrales bacterium]|nr:flagellar biosynthetic protein FliO [Candidatus Acidoferrales bacterium]
MNDLSQLSTLAARVSTLPPEAGVTTRGSSLPPSNMLRSISRAASWILDKARKQQVRKVLKVCESVSLGEKRFVAVVQVEHERFLIGGAPTSVSMLARLEPESFSEALRNSRQAGES